MQFSFIWCFLFLFFSFTEVYFIFLHTSFFSWDAVQKKDFFERNTLFKMLECFVKTSMLIGSSLPLLFSACLPSLLLTAKLLIWIPHSFVLWPPLLYFQFFPFSSFLILCPPPVLPPLTLQSLWSFVFPSKTCSESICLSACSTSSTALWCVQAEKLGLFSVLVRSPVTSGITLGLDWNVSLSSWGSLLHSHLQEKLLKEALLYSSPNSATQCWIKKRMPKKWICYKLSFSFSYKKSSNYSIFKYKQRYFWKLPFFIFHILSNHFCPFLFFHIHAIIKLYYLFNDTRFLW